MTIPRFGIVPNVGADSTARFWANHNGCLKTPVEELLPNTMNDGFTVQKFTYGDCNDSSEVIFYKIDGAPHTIMRQANDIIAAEEIWNFFSRHKKREPLPSAISEITKATHVYPNPFSSHITVELGINRVSRLSVYDMFGKEILKITLENIDFPESVNLQTDHLQAGIYFLKLKGSHNTYIRKIIKQG